MGNDTGKTRDKADVLLVALGAVNRQRAEIYAELQAACHRAAALKHAWTAITTTAQPADFADLRSRANTLANEADVVVVALREALEGNMRASAEFTLMYNELTAAKVAEGSKNG